MIPESEVSQLILETLTHVAMNKFPEGSLAKARKYYRNLWRQNPALVSQF